MADSNSLSRKRWWYLMPVIFITYSLAYLDRANYGFAAAAGIDSDLGITKSVSSLIGALFFLGYFFFQVPCAIYAVQRSIHRLIFVSLVLWGVCATATGFVSNIPVLMGIRFLLGVVEAAVFPAMLIFISNWFTSAERSRANTLLILGNPVPCCGCQWCPAIWYRHMAGEGCSLSKVYRPLPGPSSGMSWCATSPIR